MLCSNCEINETELGHGVCEACLVKSLSAVKMDGKSRILLLSKQEILLTLKAVGNQVADLRAIVIRYPGPRRAIIELISEYKEILKKIYEIW